MSSKIRKQNLILQKQSKNNRVHIQRSNTIERIHNSLIKSRRTKKKSSYSTCFTYIRHIYHGKNLGCTVWWLCLRFATKPLWQNWLQIMFCSTVLYMAKRAKTTGRAAQKKIVHKLSEKITYYSTLWLLKGTKLRDCPPPNFVIFFFQTSSSRAGREVIPRARTKNE